MSLVTYDGIQLPYAFATQFEQEVVYDDTMGGSGAMGGGGTDWYCTRFDIRIQSLVNFDFVAQMAPDLVGTPIDTASLLMKVIRPRLLKPRKTLSYKFNGIELIPLAQTGLVGTVDAQNGPKPQSCTILELDNQTFLINYHIIAHYWESNSAVEDLVTVRNKVANPILYNRWSETIDIDGSNFGKRTREGKYVIRSDNALGLTADQFRASWAVVGVPRGFLRESSSYTVSPDGLGVSYRIVDREAFRMPPFPAFEATGYYTESTQTNGAIRYGEVLVSLRASKNTNRSQLIETALAVCSIKLDVNGLITVVEQAHIRVDLYDNRVEAYVRCMFEPGRLGNSNSRIKGIHGFRGGAEMAFTPGSADENGNDILPPTYLDFGTCGYLMRTAAYFDPSLLQTFNKQQGTIQPGVMVGQAGVNLE